MYEAQAVFFYSDLSSDLMLIPHILFINLNGEKNQHMHKDLKDRSRWIRTFRNQDGRTRTGRWKTGSCQPCFDGFGANFWTRLPNFLGHNKDRDDVCTLNREQEQEQAEQVFYFSLRWFVILFFDEDFHFNNQRLAEKVSAVFSFR